MQADKQLKFLKYSLLFFILSFLPFRPALAANPLPDSFSATYAVSKGILTLAYITRTLKPLDNGKYVFESVSKPSALARMITDGEVLEKSIWVYADGYPRPLEYIYKNTTKDHKREVKLLFDWKNKTVTNIINGDPWKMKLTEGVQDKLLYQLTLMIDLSHKHKTLEYHVADGGSLKDYKAHIIGKEVIETEIGKFNTVKVQRKSSSRTTTFWCAQELDYLPVIIEHRTTGGRLKAQITSVKGFNYTPPEKESDF
jgi:hypothetical protein